MEFPFFIYILRLFYIKLFIYVGFYVLLKGYFITFIKFRLLYYGFFYRFIERNFSRLFQIV